MIRHLRDTREGSGHVRGVRGRDERERVREEVCVVCKPPFRVRTFAHRKEAADADSGT